MSKTCQIRWNPSVMPPRWEATFDGRVIAKNANPQTGAGYCKAVIEGGSSQKAKALGITKADIIGGIIHASGEETLPDLAAATVESEFSIDERFSILGSYVGMVAERHMASTLITGEGGLGKTFTVMKSLKTSGLSDLTKMEIGASFDGQRGYIVVKGYSTAKGLYRTLYDNRDQIIVFDDCDSILRDPTAVNILKAALDSYDERIVTWNAEGWGNDEALPKSFNFSGGVIFISNMPKSKIPQAIRSRAMCADVGMSREDVIERMWTLVRNGEFLPDTDETVKLDAMNFVEKNAFNPLVRELNLRTLISVVTVRNAADLAVWERTALYSMYGA